MLETWMRGRPKLGSASGQEKMIGKISTVQLHNR